MRLVLALALLAPLSFATNITYTITDVFPAGIGTTPLSAPNVPFTLTFTLPDHPAPSSSFSDVFNILAPAATFTFGSTTTNFAANPPLGAPFINLTFQDSALGGGLTVIMVIPPPTFFDPLTTVVLGFSSSQLFSGPTSAPSLLTGQFPVANDGHSSYAAASGLDFFSSTGNISAVSETPEPAPVALLGLALPALWLIRRRASVKMG